MAIWTKKSDLQGTTIKYTKDICTISSPETFGAFLKDIFQLITIMGVFGAITIYINTSMGFFNQSKNFNLGFIPNVGAYVNPDNIFYQNGLTSFGDIILSVGIAASLWVFCVIAINILNQARKNKFQNILDSSANTVFMFSLGVLTLVVTLMIIRQFINLYLFFIVMMLSFVYGRLKTVNERWPMLKSKTVGFNKLIRLNIVSNIIYGIATFFSVIVPFLNLIFKIPLNFVLILLMFGFVLMIISAIMNSYFIKKMNKMSEQLKDANVCTSLNQDCKYRGPNLECNLKIKGN